MLSLRSVFTRMLHFFFRFNSGYLLNYAIIVLFIYFLILVSVSFYSDSVQPFYG